MPIYEYHCDKCNNVFEEWHKHIDDIDGQPCPQCHETAHRIISNTSFVLKGGGWYVTEYGNRKSDTASSNTTSPNTTLSDAAKDTGVKETKETTAPAEKTPAPAASVAAD